jgi:hypothetical protein
MSEGCVADFSANKPTGQPIGDGPHGTNGRRENFALMEAV